MNWKNLLGTVSESVNAQLRLRHDYLVAENRILRNQIDGRVQLSDAERRELAEIGAQLGKPALAEIATVAQADTILAWHRKFATQRVNSSAPPKSVGRPRVAPEIEEWVIRMARENRSWGYDRIQGSLKHLGYTISDQTVGNILKRHGIPPAPERQKTVTWGEFVRSHWDVLVATGFFNCEVWSWLGPMISFLLSFIHFGCHHVQSVRRALHRPKVSMQALMRQSLDLSLQMRRWVHLVVQQSHARRSEETVLDQAGSEFEICDAQQMRSQDMGKVVVLSDAYARPIRDGPIRRHRRLDSLRIDDEREAA
jgi:putative transposase